MPYDFLEAVEDSAIRDKHTPVEVLSGAAPRYPAVSGAQLATWVERFFRLWCQNQWKRERYAPSFHLDDRNVDPRSWCRFPILSGGFERELAEMRAYVAIGASADRVDASPTSIARPALTVDCVVFGLDENDLKVLLIQRELAAVPARRGRCPGGFVRIDETLDEAARRELEEEAGVDRRLPRAALHVRRARPRSARARGHGRVLRAREAQRPPHPRRDRRDGRRPGSPSTTCRSSRSITPRSSPRAHERLRGKVRYAPIGFELLPPKFSLTQLQRLYEIILGAELDKRNFRKKILAMELLVEPDEVEQGVATAPRGSTASTNAAIRSW